ncbi:MAG: hypothetical protein ACHQIH_04645, partial [Ignavibacteria bacterium]
MKNSFKILFLSSFLFFFYSCADDPIVPKDIEPVPLIEGWESQNSGTDEDLFSIFMENENTGYIVGQSGIILHTTNSGANW